MWAVLGLLKIKVLECHLKLDISRDWTINAILISHSSAVPLSIKVNLIMFLILTAEVLYNGVWWKVCCFNVQWINLCHFLDVFVNLYQPMNYIKFTTKFVAGAWGQDPRYRWRFFIEILLQTCPHKVMYTTCSISNNWKLIENKPFI